MTYMEIAQIILTIIKDWAAPTILLAGGGFAGYKLILTFLRSNERSQKLFIEELRIMRKEDREFRLEDRKATESMLNGFVDKMALVTRTKV